TSKSQQEKYVGAICSEVFQKFPDFVHRCKDESFEALSDPMYSGKMKVLEKLLKYYLQRKDKVLLFSLSTKLLDLLESFCMAQGLDFSRLDGTTKAKDRVQIVKEFNSSTHINLCLVSTLAGGLGLNFVGANVVVLFDPTWNPASDLQAIDRAYRIGQIRNVTVLRLISLGTVEEVIYLRQVYKQQLQCSVLGKESSRRYFEAVPGDCKGELFGIRNLFRLQTQGTCLTQKILEREGQVEAGVTTTSVHTGEGAGASGSGNSRVRPDDKPANERGEALLVPKGVLDFSSGSEEDECEFQKNAVDTRRSGNAATEPASLLQHGFSKLLERLNGNPQSTKEDSCPSLEESSEEEDENQQAVQRVKTEKRREMTRSTKENTSGCNGGNRRGKREDYKKQRQRVSIKDRSKPSEDIEMFTSSEEEHTPSKKGRAAGGHITSSRTERSIFKKSGQSSKSSSSSSLKCQTSPTSSEKAGAIDSVLGQGRVQEVKYTHSNQRVVGGSRAEELISRAAERDVFERRMYSQLPANHILDNTESLSASSPGGQPCPSAGRQKKPKMDHPVTFTKTSVRHTKHTTFIIGETPQAIRRYCKQQLEEMAAKFKFPSVHQFAVEILRSDPGQRVTWLRQYYMSLNHPGLSNTVTNDFPQPDITQSTSSTSSIIAAMKNPRKPQTGVQEPHKNKKVPRK
uniref:Helicase C-terminal domain-containing protein n=1 Tax=Tetraodon nigroviridis TaxID=99883 RepID=H3CHG5_TETNG